MRFDGAVYTPAMDNPRLENQLARIHAVMRDGEWRTLRDIATLTGDPESSISAQLRHLRKERFGSYRLNKRPRGVREMGLWEYQLLGQGRLL